MRKFGWVVFSVGMLFASSVFAVFIDGGDGSGNTNAPPDDPGWDRVGHIVIANPSTLSSVTYLGDKWFITAHHVKQIDNPSEVWLNGQTYDIDSGSWTRITNNAGPPHFGADADLTLFQITEQPDVLPSRIRSSQIPSNADLIMIGDGRNRVTNLIHWTSSWVVTNEASGFYSGYYRIAGSAMRWGTNTVSSRNWFDSGYGTQYGFQTTFDEGAGSNECHAARYDSGGGVFYKNGGDWELAGIIVSEGDWFPGQTDGKAVYGNETFIADVSYYRAQITSQIVNFDTDIDGLPDWWESEHSASTTAMVASTDSDSDEYTNLEEWYADTNPTNSASFPEIDEIAASTNQTVEFNGSTNRLYQLHATTNLVEAGWGEEGSSTLGTGTNSSITVTNTDDQVFYRLHVTLP